VALTLRVALAVVALAGAALPHALAQPDNRPAFQYFFDERPNTSALEAMPPDASNVFFGRVRLIVVTSNRPRSDYLLMAQVEVFMPLQGQPPACRRTVMGCLLYPRFGSMNPPSRPIFPDDPIDKTRDYWIAGYVDPAGTVVLRGLPASADEYDDWFRSWLSRRIFITPKREQP
jgi:hypothetical protein